MRVRAETLLSLQMPDGSLWEVPVRVVATSLGAHHVTQGVARTLDEGVRYALQEPWLLLEWVRAEMDWRDLEPHAALVSPPPPMDYHRAYAEARVWFDPGSLEPSPEEA